MTRGQKVLPQNLPHSHYIYQFEKPFCISQEPKLGLAGLDLLEYILMPMGRCAGKANKVKNITKDIPIFKRDLSKYKKFSWRQTIPR